MILSLLKFMTVIEFSSETRLVARVFSLILTASETVIYYVTSAEPPNPACSQDGQPCQTLNHYFTYNEEYFNSSTVNITMKLLGGIHFLYHDNDEFDCGYCAGVLGCNKIEDLEMFEMVGLEPAHNYCCTDTIQYCVDQYHQIPFCKFKRLLD